MNKPTNVRNATVSIEPDYRKGKFTIYELHIPFSKTNEDTTHSPYLLNITALWSF